MTNKESTTASKGHEKKVPLKDAANVIFTSVDGTAVSLAKSKNESTDVVVTKLLLSFFKKVPSIESLVDGNGDGEDNIPAPFEIIRLGCFEMDLNNAQEMADAIKKAVEDSK